MRRLVFLYLATVLLFCGAVVVGLVAVPAPAYPQAPCGALVILERGLKQMEERLMAIGHGNKQFRLYVDPVGRGWTVLAADPNGMACVMGTGQHFELVRHPPGNPS